MNDDGELVDPPTTSVDIVGGAMELALFVFTILTVVYMLSAIVFMVPAVLFGRTVRDSRPSH
jgi:hypothetical protein